MKISLFHILMLRKILIIFTVCINFLLISCREDITLEIPPYESKLAVFCVLNPFREPALLLNRSKANFNYADTSRETQYITDALVVITDLTTGVKDTLKVRNFGQASWPMNGGGFHTTQPYYVGKNKPEIGHRYKLEIWHKNEYLHAETFIPQPVTIKSVTYKKSKSIEYEGFNDVTFTLKFDDIAGEQNAYVTTMLTSGNYYDYTYKYDHNNDGKELTDQHRIIMYPHDTGLIPLAVENHTLQTAEYISALYKQSEFTTHFFTEPSIVKHNINGGLGIFGAVSRHQFYFVVHVK